jgi:hypothetical protein
MERKIFLGGAIALYTVLLGGKFLFGFEPSESVRDAIDGLALFLMTVVLVRDWDASHK